MHTRSIVILAAAIVTIAILILLAEYSTYYVYSKVRDLIEVEIYPIHAMPMDQYNMHAGDPTRCLETAICGTSNRVDAISAYFEQMVTHANDAQNVHDTAVNSDLRAILARYESTYSGISPASVIQIIGRLLEARMYDTPPISGTQLRGGYTALNKFSQGGYISTFDRTEDHILAVVYDRATHPANAAVLPQMYAALTDSLIDCIEHDILVCANGRVSRILNAYATLDFDPNISAVLTLEEYRNQIYREVKTLLENEIAAARTSTDPQIAAVAHAYDTGTLADSASESKFSENTKKKIDTLLAQYEPRISTHDMDTIREACYMYIVI